MGYGPPENIHISLANGNIMKIPLTRVNISEEVNKTGIWQQVNEGNEKSKQSKILIKQVSKKILSSLRRLYKNKTDPYEVK